MAEVQGHVDPKFEELRKLMQTFIETKEELGCSLVVNIDGKDLVDLWGGYADEERTKPWSSDTITNVWSSSKTVSSLATLMLVDRGQLDVNERVSKYWPEFAQNGKEDVYVRHFLSHSSGLSGWEEPITGAQVCDWDYSVGKLEKQAPWFTPGSASGYHSLTMGHLLGELVRRQTGKHLKDFIAEELAGPLGADFQLGAVEKDWPRVSNVVPPPGPGGLGPFEEGSVAFKTFTNPVMDATVAHRDFWRRGDVGAANGHSNARGLNKVLSVIPLGGEVNGKRILKPETIELIWNEQVRGVDLAMGAPVRFGIGYGLTGDGDTVVDDLLPAGKVCYWGGWGGSLCIMDTERKLTITYVMNKMSAVGLGNIAGRAYIQAIYRALGVAPAKGATAAP